MTDFEKEVLTRLKRLETKVTHSLEVQGINTTDTIKDEINPSKIYIKKVDDRSVVEVLNKDVSIAILEKYLENKFGEFDLVIGDKLICTIKR